MPLEIKRPGRDALVTGVTVRSGFRIVVLWSDGASSLIGMSRLIRRGGVYARLQASGAFNKVRIGQDGRSIEWYDPAHDDPENVVAINAAALRRMVTIAPVGESGDEASWVSGFTTLLMRMDDRMSRIESLLEGLMPPDPEKPPGLGGGSRGEELIQAAMSIKKPEWVRMGEVTRRFGIPWTKLYHLAAAGEIGLMNIGRGALRVDVASVRAFLERHSTAEPVQSPDKSGGDRGPSIRREAHPSGPRPDDP